MKKGLIVCLIALACVQSFQVFNSFSGAFRKAHIVGRDSKEASPIPKPFTVLLDSLSSNIAYDDDHKKKKHHRGRDTDEEEHRHNSKKVEEVAQVLGSKNRRVSRSKSGTCVKFTNLGEQITARDLEELCSDIGDIMAVTGMSGGQATVEFVHRIDASTCIAKYNGVPLDGKIMNVALDEASSKPDSVFGRLGSSLMRTSSHKLVSAGKIQNASLMTIKVGDPSMNYSMDSEAVEAVANHLFLADDSKGYQSLLIYGHPGCGKTRFLRELTNAAYDSEHPLREKLNSQQNQFAEWLPIALTFNGETPASRTDKVLASQDELLPLWVRLLYSYCEHPEVKFQQFAKLMSKQLVDWNPSSVEELLSQLLASSNNNSGVAQRKHVLLLIDENLNLANYVSKAAFQEFLSAVNRLQDRPMFAESDMRIRVLWTGLRSGPWKLLKSPSGRTIVTQMLRPLPEDVAASLIHGMDGDSDRERGLQLIAGRYRSVRKGVQSADLIAKQLAAFSMGLPRAIELTRHYLAHVFTTTSLRVVCDGLAKLVQRKYDTEPEEAALHLALLGRVVHETTRPLGPLTSQIHQWMSEGSCMVDGRVPNSDFDVVMVPPLRLISADCRKGLLSRQPFNRLPTLLNTGLDLDSKQFEVLLAEHELQLRSSRAWAVSRGDVMQATHAPQYNCLTLHQLYCTLENPLGDIRVEWRNEALKSLQFDFTTPLAYEGERTTFPRAEEAEKYKNFLVFPDKKNHKGFEFGLILTASDGGTVVVAVQTKLTSVDAVQEAQEISDAAQKTEEVLSDLGWSKDRVVTVFLTNRPRRQYSSTVVGHNVILLCGESLQEYLGPTVWAIARASEALSGLEGGTA